LRLTATPVFRPLCLFIRVNRVGVSSEVCSRDVDTGVVGARHPAPRLHSVSKTLNKAMSEMAHEVVQ
jgi:hypothetical protein